MLLVELLNRCLLVVFFPCSAFFAFLNYVDTDAKDLLNHQYVERQKQSLTMNITRQKQILAKKKTKKNWTKNIKKDCRVLRQNW